MEEGINNLINAIKSSIPEGPYDAFQDWLDSVDKKIKGLIDIIELIRAAINKINTILQIGGTGMWVLGIGNANGIDGLKERFVKVSKPIELTNAKYVTGLVLVTPNLQIGPVSGPGILELFDKIPSEGTDSVKVPSTSFKNIFNDTKKAIKKEKEDTENLVKTKIKDIDSAKIIDIGIQLHILDKSAAIKDKVETS